VTTNILILCTHNSARSVLGEAMLNHWATRYGKDVRAFSAGSVPSGRINPYALQVLQDTGIENPGYRSKSRDEFVGPRTCHRCTSSSPFATARQPNSAPIGREAR
jgi:arsenate reductase (thioredoxin)